MSSLALMEVQHAIYAKLHGDGVLMGMVTGVFDVVPQETALPYVRIGDGQSQTVAADGVAVSDVLLEMDVWGEATGRKKVLMILNRLHAMLHLGTLSLGGFQLVLMRCEQASTEVTGQGELVHGVLSVRLSVVEA